MWEKAGKLLSLERGIQAAASPVRGSWSVQSFSSPTPHFVTCKESGQVSCDPQCSRWVALKMCSHTLAVAERTGQLSAFLKWYTTTNQGVNMTNLSMLNMPQGRGQKGGVPKRKRPRKKAPEPEMVTSRPSLVTATSIQSGSSSSTSGVPSQGPSSMFNNQSPTFHYTSPVVPSQMSSSSSGSHRSPTSTLNYQSPTFHYSPFPGPVIPPSAAPYHLPPGLPNVTISGPLPTSVSMCGSAGHSTSPRWYPQPVYSNTPGPEPNLNPFYLKFITGNIRTCQGCRGSLRAADSSIPASPNNLCVARSEKRAYRNNSGTLVTPTTFKPSHYHSVLTCVQAAEPYFMPYSLKVPPDVYSQLTFEHKQYLWMHFGLYL